VGLCLLGLLLVGCGGTGGEGEYGDWTMAADSLRLTETLRVSETDAFYLGSVRDVAVTSDGRIVVADGQAHHLKVLAPDGTLLDSLGQEGEGPGEFRALPSVQVARGDSIYAYDDRQRRLTAFSAPSLEQTRTFTITGEGGVAGRVLVLGDRLVGGFSDGLMAYQNADTPRRYWRVVGPGGTPGDTLVHTRRRAMAMTSGGEIFRFWSIPFGRSSQVAAGPDGRLYHGWTDSLHVRASAPDGTTRVVASVPTPSVPVREAERDSALERVNTDALRAKVADKLPATKPAFTDLVVSGDGRLWVRRPPHGRAARSATWWVLAPETKTIRPTRLPREVDLHAVTGGAAYGATTTARGAPAVVRYRVGATE
jgi:hypothetical protein